MQVNISEYIMLDSHGMSSLGKKQTSRLFFPHTYSRESPMTMNEISESSSVSIATPRKTRCILSMLVNMQ